MKYKYITDNNLYNKQTYMYSDYEGMLFIKKYLNSRNAYLEQHKNIENRVLKKIKEGDSPTQRNLRELLHQLNCGENGREDICAVDYYTKSFEVRKRIYTEYDSNWKPFENACFEEYESYLLFADCLLSAYRKTSCLKYFSCLLKLDDTLLSIQNQLDDSARGYLSSILSQELEIFSSLADKNEICWEV